MNEQQKQQQIGNAVREVDINQNWNQKNLVIIKSQRQIKGVALGHKNGLGAGIGLDETHNIVDKIYLLNNYYYYYIN